MKISDKKVQVKDIDDIFTNSPEYHCFKAVCCFNNHESRRLSKMSVKDHVHNVTFISAPLFEYEIVIEGLALNCFENHKVNILLTFGAEQKDWETTDKRLKKITRSNHAVFIDADIYSVLDGEIQMYNPTIIESECCSSELGFSLNSTHL
ncbi:hypothetical protein [Shewanella sp. 10N.286.48.B5]|uniref:hypothetical protein n=1 Tax=Shewanella sp. 10N.286.48.B5 TaxID=1880834 RepID=UPI000C838971|nr:hypothetical protein [Shewanella sp. 10N.286.48.B5]PMH85895.1 hypothetical protein BCU57_12725 [Shewanella sp. 10N.286.48.B5]